MNMKIQIKVNVVLQAPFEVCFVYQCIYVPKM
jgi:hypothetical protein